MMKGKMIQAIVALLSIASSTTAQTLSVASVEATTDGLAELVVNASGMSGVTALQFNLSLPQGITLNESAITKGEAVSGHTLSVQTMDNGDRLVVLYHSDLGLVGNGTLLRIPITVGHQAGNFSGSLYTVRTANTKAESHECSAVGFSIVLDGVDGIREVSGTKDTVGWYDLNGRLINGRPSAKGIYIQEGRKEVLK